ncbi:hypothetical protein INT47_009434 [Mucor saturninus]|uniref:PPM-type phosphatase domain-containing protein n=1 Tax=Mucor saturninus TaxID=64648 RepID=A0A8H7UV67_9FUNG|nr:hypothetical protein INT47_009434 [Mucor saturninus]
MEPVDTELTQLNISEQLRANSSFMKIMATLFHYGNQSMNAAQLVIAVRALNLLPLRGETPKSTIQGIISTSRKIARDLKISDPFRIDKDGVGRQAKYAIADEILNGIKAPEKMAIPDEPIILRPVEYVASGGNYANPSGKRQRKISLIKHAKKKSKLHKLKRKENGEGTSDIEVDTDEDEYEFASLGSEEEGADSNELVEEDTIVDYSLLYSPPTTDVDYIDPINFTDYPIAGHFAIVQQKGYSYPRFRSHEKVKIPKVNCEDKFRVTDILKDGVVKGRLFILADGHGGPGCSEYFVRKTPAAVEKVCYDYDPATLGDEKVQKKLENDIKIMIQTLDDEYLTMKREQIARKATPEEHVDNDGCTLILNIFLGEWLININVGDSRTVLISAPEPSGKAPPTSIENANTLGTDSDYKMDVVFASQDHKPYLEHLARHILENGGEFVDSVQNRVIKVEKLREDGNRHAKRVSLKNARIRPKDYQAGLDKTAALAAEAAETEVPGWAAQSAVRTTANTNTTSNPQPLVKNRIREDRIPSLNVARSCGDLDFKMDPLHKIISCEPDVTFIRISDQPYVDHTILLNGPHKEKRRHFLFMSTDGTFDYMYEETAERQNRAIAKVLGPMIEDGEKIGRFFLEEEERVKGETIEHGKENMPDADNDIKEDSMEIDSQSPSGTTEANDVASSNEDKKEDVKDKKVEKEDDTDVKKEDDTDEKKEDEKKEDEKKEDEKKKDEKKEDEKNESSEQDSTKEENVKEDSASNENAEKETKNDENTKEDSAKSDVVPMDVDIPSSDEDTLELPRIPLLYRELTKEEAYARKLKERTLVSSARYFANRESAHGFFASTLQDYDDCTIILVEI